MGKKISFSATFIASLIKMNGQDQKAAANAIEKLMQDPTPPSLHVHSIDREKCDKKLMSARANLDVRIIFVNRGEIRTLLYIDHHDAAYDWCRGKIWSQTAFGAEYLWDGDLADEKLRTFSEYDGTLDYLMPASKKGMLEEHGIKKKDLVKLGIQEVHAENLLKVTDEDLLLSYIEIFPGELQEAILDLATGNKGFDTVYNDLCLQNADPEENDTVRRFYTTDDIDELKVLIENEEFERWTLFLHPSQKKLVTMNCNGPMLIEGGPGTGKTIVGIHRAVRLAAEEYTAEKDCKILFCTYSKKLANHIRLKVNNLCRQKGVYNNIDVMSVDSYIAKMLGNRALPVQPDKVRAIVERAYDNGNWGASFEMLLQEYYEVIEKDDIKSVEEYIAADRSGRGRPMSANARKAIWPFFEQIQRAKNAEKAYSFVDRAIQFERLLESGEISKQYDAIIIDEAQDLEPIKIKGLCHSAKNSRNGICILSDRNQRIFRLNAWSIDAGINIKGRTYYLRLNYRTTKQINDYARSQFAEFDISSAASREYISIMSGADPEIIACGSEREENRLIVERIKRMRGTYALHEICVLAPNHEKLNAINAVFEYEGIATHLLTGDEIPEQDERVNICTTSGVKGLEFTAIIISAFNKIGTQRQLYGSSAENAIDHEKLVECEKYVAITRARDSVIITYVGE